MGIRVVWDDAQDRREQIIHYIFERQWTWDEFFTAVDTAQTMIEADPGDVGVIMEGKDRGMTFPPNALTNMRRALKNIHPKTRVIVVVLRNPFIRVVVSNLVRMTRSHKLHILDDLEQARSLVKAHLDAQ